MIPAQNPAAAAVILATLLACAPVLAATVEYDLTIAEEKVTLIFGYVRDVEPA